MIERAAQARQEALSEITRLTLSSFSNESIIREAEIALLSYLRIRELKEQMREAYPVSCSCNCHQDDTP